MVRWSYGHPCPSWRRKDSTFIVVAVDALRELLAQHALFSLGILLLLGFLIGKLANRVGLPEITGYIVAGLLVGEAFLGVIPPHMGEGLGLVTEVALGLIAITIGGEFYWVKLKRLGSAIVIVTVVQLFAAFAVVSVALALLGMPTPFALLLGAIASATAPAATVAIVQSLRAQGTFIDYLYGVVALDDAGAVILFGVVFAVASSILGDVGGAAAAAEGAIAAGAGAEAVHGAAQAAGTAAHGGGGALSIVFHALSEVGFSLLLGVAVGLSIHLLARRRTNQNEILITSLGVLFLSTAMAIVFNLSPLLTNMTAGALIINLSPDNHRIFRILRPLTPPIYALFFVIAGTELRPAVLADPQILLLGGVYIVTRAIGKYGGVWVGCRLSKTTTAIRNYLGICMLPQAGVAIGLVLLIEASPAMAALPVQYQPIIATMVNIILLSVFVNELIGPPLSRFAIIRGNDMNGRRAHEPVRDPGQAKLPRGCPRPDEGRDDQHGWRNWQRCLHDSGVRDGTPPRFATALADREAQGSTAFGNEIAIPHARLAGLDRFLLFIVSTPRGVWSSRRLDRKKRVKLFFVILGPTEAVTDHLKILAFVSRALSHTDLKRELLAARTETALYEAFLRNTQADRAEDGARPGDEAGHDQPLRGGVPLPHSGTPHRGGYRGRHDH